MFLELHDLINSYCARPGSNLTTLSRVSGVPYGSVKRIAQNESVPELHNALKILMVVCPSPDQAYRFIEKYYPWIGEFLLKLNTLPCSANTNRALRDRVSFYIIHMAGSGGYTTAADVLELYGRNGLETLNGLLEQGVLHEDNGRIYCEELAVTNIDTLLEQIRFCLDDFDKENLGEAGEHAIASLFVLDLNKAGRRKLNLLLKQYAENVIELKNEEKFRGHEPTYTALFSNILKGALC